MRAFGAEPAGGVQQDLAQIGFSLNSSATIAESR